MTTIGLSYSLVKISTKCAPALIQARLGMRNFMEELRSAGVQTGGPAPFNAADKQRFANALDKWLLKGKLS